jgi:DNA-binding protein H-NS
MAKLTVSEIKRQIAALEAKAARLTEVEMRNSIAKVRSLMASLGVTIEHLGSKVSSAATSVKVAVVGKTAPAKKSQARRAGAGIPKFRDPKTGKTWTGTGKPPAWIASKNRDKFRIGGADASATNSDAPSAPAKKAAKKAGRKVATKVKTAAKKVVRATKASASAASAAVKKTAKKSSAAKKVVAVKKATSPKAVAKKAPAKRAAAKSAAAPASGESAAAPAVAATN